jgi:type II secretory pathway pseudopilin PulG
MLVVMFILSILISMLAVAVSKAKAMARQTDCKSSMRQFGVAILVYRGDHRGSNPAWLSSLYPTYVDDRHMYVCRSDRARGTGRTRPVGLIPYTGDADTISQQAYPETIDNQSNSHWGNYGQNTNVTTCSYFYEFSAAPISWASSTTNTWCQYKEDQLLKGDKNSDPPTVNSSNPKPYSSSRMPMIRCYHHFAEGQIRAHADDKGTVDWTKIESKPITINVAYAGNVYVGPLLWEAALLPGER